jgi:hypothetical protein
MDFNKLDRTVTALGGVAGITDQLCTVKYGEDAGFASEGGVAGGRLQVAGIVGRR